MTAIYETCVCGIIFYFTPTLVFKLLYELPHLDLTQTILNIKLNVSIKCKIGGN